MGRVDPKRFTLLTRRLRSFFEKKGFLEVHTQDRLSLLTTCDEPSTISLHSCQGQAWPLPQTGQIWLERELLGRPGGAPGYFSISTSYRNAYDPVPGCDDQVFPVFEFEFRGGFEALVALEKELLAFLGFGAKERHAEVDYVRAALDSGQTRLDHVREALLGEEHGTVVLLKDFPVSATTLWNVALGPRSCFRGALRPKAVPVAKKADVLLWGIKVIEGAQRADCPRKARKQFYALGARGHSRALFSHFTRARVQRELEEFLSLSFFERSGGTVRLARLADAMIKSGLL